ncbi:hypothetical protein CGRA01v4_13328 [Colletotrichum graminicola]|uniref:Uncharacterized protein n=1 Tax=Colletotrichum graminicola (strain M1.001 / M2 / FGSC 10212) TaxID=645133 RepID=E3QQA7_COLGM|nr:uncharacterized protein GLRG_08189 [Colletotrichum graminicola M1.001]EFQ33045.1 hypothetical protein GLRG_08189 [Colletotrichum graminicola M1.001]WDK22038.1 hypothetical protein CGRA01v4_13328 [Colletotrichum graminicola]
MKSTLLGFAALAALLAPAVAIPLFPTNDTTSYDTVGLKGGFDPAKIMEKDCLRWCPHIVPGLHAYKQPATFDCRLRCRSEAFYRASRQVSSQAAKAAINKTRAEGFSREPVVPLELGLFLKKHRLLNTTGIESRSEGDMASQVAVGGDEVKIDPKKPKGNPCAWPTEWDNSAESQREMHTCLASCPVGSFFGVCLHPCFLEIMERRCGEKTAEQYYKPQGAEHWAGIRRQWGPNLPGIPPEKLPKLLVDYPPITHNFPGGGNAIPGDEYLLD